MSNKTVDQTNDRTESNGVKICGMVQYALVLVLIFLTIMLCRLNSSVGAMREEMAQLRSMAQVGSQSGTGELQQSTQAGEGADAGDGQGDSSVRQKYADRIAGISDYESGQALRQTILSDSLLGEDDRDDLDDMLVNKLACMTSADLPIAIPTLGSNFSPDAWIENVMARLTNENASVEERAADFIKVEEFLSQAEASGALTNVLQGIKPVGVGLYTRCWVKQARSAIEGLSVPERETASLATINDMISQTDTFSEEQKLRVHKTIEDLHRAVFNAALAEVKAGIDNIWGLKGDIPDEDIQQLAGAQHANCLQMLCRIEELNRRYPGAFTYERKELIEKSRALSGMVAGYREMTAINERDRQKNQRDRFLNFAKRTIASAEQFYAEGVAQENQWSKTRKDPEVQGSYEIAWKTLIRVDPNDLSAVDPALNKKLRELLENIEGRLDKDRRELTNVHYQRIKDF